MWKTLKRIIAREGLIIIGIAMLSVSIKVVELYIVRSVSELDFSGIPNDYYVIVGDMVMYFFVIGGLTALIRFIIWAVRTLKEKE